MSVVQSGEMPLWNPYNYSGIPLLATLQPGVFYPPHVLYLLLPFNIVWNWLIVLHFALAGVGVYFLLQYLKVSRAGSFVGGIVFMLSGYLVSVHNLLPHLLSVSWFPLVVLFFIKSLDSGRARHIILTAVFLAMEFLAGAPEIVMLTIPVMLMLALFGKTIVAKDVALLFPWKVFFLVVFLFSLLVSAQFLPFYELKQHSIRVTGLPYREAITWSLAWKDFVQFFLPDPFGYGQSDQKYWGNQSWLKTIYLGMVPFVLSVFYSIGRDRKRWLLLGLVVLSLIFALGGNTPLYKVLYKIPPFSGIRYPVKFLFLFFFVVSVTAGFGFDSLREQVERGEQKTRILVKCFLGTGIVFLLIWGCANVFDGHISGYLNEHGIKPPVFNEIWFNLHNLKRFLFISFLFCVMLYLYLRANSRKWIGVGIVVVLVIDLFLANYGYYGRVPWKWFTAKTGFVEALSANRETSRYFVTPKTEKDFEYVLYGKPIASSPYASMFMLYSVGGAEVMRVFYEDLFTTISSCGRKIETGQRYFDLTGTRHIITSYEVKDEGFRLVRQETLGDKKAYLYEYVRHSRRSFVCGKGHFVESDQRVINMLRDEKIDLKREVVISDPHRRGTKGDARTMGKADILSLRPNEVVLAVASDNEAFLYLSDTYYPGWRAYVDGRETKIYRANLAFRAIEVPKGRHTVVFRYVPMSFYIGLVLTLIGIALCVWLWRRDGRKAVVPGVWQEGDIPGSENAGT